ncbi:MAG: glycoside hydrolase family 38 C-terminal domain-containing protein [bacterium]
MTDRTTAIVVAHTHWDREWYLPFQLFRRRLVETTDALISLLKSDPGFTCFVFDGQAIALEDYLEARPERKAELRELIKGGRLLAGPWYVLPDEFLVSGESLIRNLETGIRAARRMGGAMMTGYVPDPFGHVSQLPQILRGFGMDAAVFTRGGGADPAHERLVFRWRAPSGHSVLAVHQLVHGYGNFAFLPEDPDRLEALARERLEAMKEHASLPVFLLCNGMDHEPADAGLPGKLRVLGERIPEVEFRQGSFEDFIGAVRERAVELPEFAGELRGSRYHPLLPGVLSSRVYIKQENERAQVMLENRAEPMAAMAACLAGAEYPAGELEAAWRLLLSNHPHDSICGCGVDEVHREMMPRFRQAQQIACAIVDASARSMIGGMAPGGRDFGTGSEPAPGGAMNVVVFNTSAWSRAGGCVLTLPLTVETDGLLDGAWRLWDGGEAAPVHVERGGSIVVCGKESFLSEGSVVLRFAARGVLPMGWKAYRLEREAAAPAGAGGGPDAGGVIENEFLRVEIMDNGSLGVRDKRSGMGYTGLLVFEDEGDVGDEYDFCPSGGKPLSTGKVKADVEVVRRGGVLSAAVIRLGMRLPVGCEGGARSREKVRCPITTTLYLWGGVPRLDVVTRVYNAARDHRLRVVFPTPFRKGEAAADSAFHVVKRPWETEAGEGWCQPPAGTHPQQSFFSISGEGGGLAVLSRGLYEYEVRKEKGRLTGYLTLLRCVGWLSRKRLSTRPSQAGPELPTPEAQCQGEHEFHYSVFVHRGDWRAGGAWREAADFRNPLIAAYEGDLFGARAAAAWMDAAGGVVVKEPAGSARGGSVVPAVAGRAGGARAALPAEGSFFEVEPSSVVVSSVRLRGESRLEVRVYSVADVTAAARIRFFPPVESAVRVNFLGEPAGGGGEVEVKGGAVAFEIAPFEIVTLSVRLGSRPD